MKQQLLAGMLLLSSGLFAQDETAVKYAATVTAADLKTHLTIVAGKEMEGRETATEGQRKAAAYIENHFKSLGLKPGNGSSYQQMYPVYQDQLTEKKLSVNGRMFEWDKDFSMNLQSATSIFQQSAANGSWITTETVFVGYGIVDSANNDYKGLDVKGKIVVVLEGTRGQGNAANLLNSPTSLNGKINAARNNGAIGLLLVSKDFPKRNASPVTGPMYFTKQATAANNFITVNISEAVASALLGRTSIQNSTSLLESKKATYKAELKLVAKKETLNLESSNVLGVIEGTDKKDEYLFITAHYDHLGKRDTVIYYGADDDGSGTVSVLELAEAFMQAKKKGKGPRRTIVFMTVSGEEKGLRGSAYYGNNPTYPLAKTTANLNIDMVGRIDPSYKGDSTNYVYVIGEDKLSSDLMKITDAVNNKFIKMELDRRYNDPKDPNRFYYRSDHYNFAAKGVPIIFYFNGVHRDYHRPTDTVDKINFDVMEKRARLIFHTAWEMANRDEMLKRDMPLNMPPR
ncbi:MAG: hypothetical protein RIR90_1928 [Bacteroidota bacterium]|jgi:hypothetical protein